VTPTTLFTIALLGCAGGSSSGLLGFGGGVVMFPLLYYVPPLNGLAPLDAKTVAAIVIHGHVSPRALRRIYAAMVIVIALRLLITVAQPGR